MSTSSTPLGNFLSSSGGQFHPSLYTTNDSTYGQSIYTRTQLEPRTTIVECPFSLCITSQTARQSIPKSLFEPESAEEMDHEYLTLYLVLHLLPPSTLSQYSQSLHLNHRPYIDNLPPSQSMKTTLYFTSEERELLRGSNLYGATIERESQWKEEWERVKSCVKDREVREEVTWERWLWSCAIISSRAFPSHLLDSNHSNSAPVLFPGIDMFNHKPTAKVTWKSDVHVETISESHGQVEGEVKKGKGMLSIVVDEVVEANTQVFNTYGAKSTEELLLGYGFILPPPNPADSLALKISIPSNHPSYDSTMKILKEVGAEDTRHLISNGSTSEGVEGGGKIPEELLIQMRLLLSSPSEVEDIAQKLSSEKVEEGEGDRNRQLRGLEFLNWENELDVLDQLEGMLESKLQGLVSVELPRDGEEEGGNVRKDVLDMIKVYRKGQISILDKAIEYRERLMEETIEKAREDGVEFDFGGEEEDEDGMVEEEEE